MESSMLTPIAIPPPLLDRIYAHARRCFPAECCGYLVGPRGEPTVDEVIECRNAQIDGDHPTEPDRGAETGFVIAGAELIAFATSFDGPRPARIVYHSHTNGRAYFSAVDREIAIARDMIETTHLAVWPAYPVQHVVVGVTGEEIIEAAQFGWSDAARDYLEVARWSTR
jgi:[CysO sulfur-carrier protein]-S-L-cysteine hydrolase